MMIEKQPEIWYWAAQPREDLRRSMMQADIEVSRATRKRRRLLAAAAIQELRLLFPEADQVLFEGPQEPGQGAWITAVLDEAGSTLSFDEGDLEEPQKYLTGALEDGLRFPARGTDLALSLRMP